MREGKPFLSVIIPTFHNENTIFYCLDSLKKQTFTDYEIIIVDASKDEKTKAVIKKWLSLFPRIAYHHLETPGTAKQVSFGVKQASGEFIGFVDSDDYVHPRMFEILVENQREYGTDISGCSLQHTQKYLSYPPSNLIEKKDAPLIFLGKRYEKLRDHYTRYTVYSRCLQIVRRVNVLARLSYYEDLKRNYWEDVIFIYGILLSSKSAVIVKTPLYYYVAGGDRPNTRSISDYSGVLEYLITHQKIAEKMFRETKNKAGVGQTYWPLLREFTYALHRSEIKNSKESFFAFVKKNKKSMARPLWGIPMSEVHGLYEKKVIWLCRLNLYSLFYQCIRPK